MDETNIDVTPYLPALIAVAIFAVIFFPLIAALVAPPGRRLTFGLLTLFVLPGPLGVACASIANPREAQPRRNFDEFIAGGPMPTGDPRA